MFRLIVNDAPDLTTIRVVGRFRDDGVALLKDMCDRARRPLVLELSELTSASEAAVSLLYRLAAEDVRIEGASQYVKLLLERAEAAPSTTPPPSKGRGPRGSRPSRPPAGAV